ncbi:MAG: NAD-dependent epimerase/dehydratase family protein [Candidatus Bathyarchaeota archaeon]
MVVLVTGGSGFIGGHVTDKLVEKGYDVRVFDQIKPLREDIEWFRGNLLNQNDLLLACKDVETIYHLAAIADVGVAISDPYACININEVGTVNILRACTSREVERIILASTTWVYGKTEEVVNEESSLPLPDHVYTKTKIGQEQLVYAWHEHFGQPYTILRYDIPYGTRMRSNMAIAIFARKAMNKEPITVFGDGTQGRCFIYIEDLAEGNIASMKPEGKNQIFNLAGAEFVTINTIIENLEKIFGSLNVSREKPRPNDFKGVIVSIDRAEKVLGWTPKVAFSKGLNNYVEFINAS